MDVTPEQLAAEHVAMTCPTCRAQQAWSRECRRCKSDLSELWDVFRAAQRARTGCLAALRNGEFDRALQAAQRFYCLDAGSEAAKLLTVCHLLRGDWSQAAAAAAGV